jgi:F0F1-type ATP synthase membrane subunit a
MTSDNIVIELRTDVVTNAQRDHNVIDFQFCVTIMLLTSKLAANLPLSLRLFSNRTPDQVSRIINC